MAEFIRKKSKRKINLEGSNHKNSTVQEKKLSSKEIMMRLSLSGLNGTELKIWMYLYSIADDKKNTPPTTYEDLQEKIGVGRTSVSGAIDNLKQQGYIEATKSGFQQGNSYKVMKPKKPQ